MVGTLWGDGDTVTYGDTGLYGDMELYGDIWGVGTLGWWERLGNMGTR